MGSGTAQTEGINEMTKELWIDTFERLVQEFMHEHPKAPESAAEAWAETMIDTRYADRLADMADYARMMAKEGKMQ